MHMENRAFRFSRVPFLTCHDSPYFSNSSSHLLTFLLEKGSEKWWQSGRVGGGEKEGSAFTGEGLKCNEICIPEMQVLAS